MWGTQVLHATLEGSKRSSTWALQLSQPRFHAGNATLSFTVKVCLSTNEGLRGVDMRACVALPVWAPRPCRLGMLQEISHGMSQWQKCHPL